MLVLIRGAGDIATGIALRLHRSGLQVVMTDLPRPTAIRRTACFSPAITDGETVVEDVRAVRADSPAQALSLLAQGAVPVLPDPECLCREQLRPDAFGLSWILTHVGPPFRFTACFDYEAALNRYYHF